MSIRGFFVTLFVVSVGASCCRGDEVPPHLTLARNLVEAVAPARNAYLGGKTRIVWPRAGTPGDEVVNESVCSSFCAALLREAYALEKADLKSLFTEEWPEADELFAGILNREKFEVIASIKDAKPGDFLIVDYQSQKKIPTGHSMLISGNPEKVASYDSQSLPFPCHPDATQTSPDVPVVWEWHVPIIDSSKGPHGKTDTRFQSAENGEDDDGVGEGVLRLLSDEKGLIAGYTWSTYRSSKLWLARDRPFVIGRWRGN